MIVTDPIADLLTRIRNANQMHYKEVVVPSSNVKIEIVKILKDEGYIADYKIENYTKLADEANWLNNEGKKNRDTVARPNITKEKEEFKHKLEQYPVIVNSKHDGEANIELLHFKDRLKDLHLNLAYGSDLPSDKYKDM